MHVKAKGCTSAQTRAGHEGMVGACESLLCQPDAQILGLCKVAILVPVLSCVKLRNQPSNTPPPKPTVEHSIPIAFSGAMLMSRRFAQIALLRTRARLHEFPLGLHFVSICSQKCPPSARALTSSACMIQTFIHMFKMTQPTNTSPPPAPNVYVAKSVLIFKHIFKMTQHRFTNTYVHMFTHGFDDGSHTPCQQLGTETRNPKPATRLNNNPSRMIHTQHINRRRNIYPPLPNPEHTHDAAQPPP